MRYISLILTVLITWFYVSSYYENKLTTYKNEQLQAVNQQLIKVRDEERKQRRRANDAVKHLNEAKHDLNLRYAELSNLRLQSDNSDDSMSRVSSNSSRTTTGSASQCARDNSEKFQKLYQRQLDLAKRCDETAIKYNELMKLVR